MLAFGIFACLGGSATPTCSVDGLTVRCRGDGELTNEIVRESGSYNRWTTAVVEEGITSLGKSAFGGCGALTSVTLPVSLVKIGSYCFQSVACTTFFFPKGLTDIASTLFNSASKLTKIEVDPENSVFCSVNGIMYRKDINGSLKMLFYVPIAITKVTIPDTIEEFGDSCLRQSKATSLVIPNSVKSIGPYAFAGSYFRTIAIGSGVSVIMNAVFESCSQLRTITVDPDNNVFSANGGVLQSETEIFFIEPGVTSLHISASICSIHDGIFTLATSLTDITVDVNNSIFTASDDDAMIIANETIAYVAKSRSATSVIIEDPISSIRSKCFADCTALQSAVIRSTNMILGNDIFRGCTNLKSVVIESPITEITKLCFKDADLSEVFTIPSSVTILRDSALYACKARTLNFPDVITFESSACIHCTELRKVVFGKVQTIASGAFDNCAKLCEVEFGNCLKTLSSNSFGRSALVSVTLPATIEDLKAYAFSRSNKLQNIYIAEGSTLYESIDGIPYSKDHEMVIACPNGRKEVELISETRVIGDQSFYGCSQLHSVKLNDDISEIQSSAFFECTSLVFIRIPGNIGFIGENAFASCSKLRNILYCNNKSTVRFKGDPFPTNPEICVFIDYDSSEGKKFCGHGVSAILDHECNIPTGYFTNYVTNTNAHTCFHLMGILNVVMLQ